MIPRFSYWLKGQLYVSITNQVRSLPPIQLRGPKFEMPSCSGFQELPSDFEPSPEQIFEEIDRFVATGKVKIDSMTADPVTFAGNGEPLLRLEAITEAARLIKETRHGLPLRVRTSGLVAQSDAEEVAAALKSSGFKFVSVALMSDNPKQYAELVQPHASFGFGDVCNFVSVATAAGLQVQCTAVERPDVSLSKVRALSSALGASSFQSYPYHP